MKEEKINLALDIAYLNRDYILKSEDKYSLYISIPFCPTTCLYCSFPSLKINDYRDEVDAYISSLKYEIDIVSKNMGIENINTVYIGGGTPTSIDPNYMEDLIQHIYSIYGSNIVEFTVEAGRPDTLNKNYLEILKSSGVDRISINPQTMVDKTLKIIGRNHSSSDIYNIYEEARKLNFSSINMDLILGLPSEGREEIFHTLKALREMSPENITVHTLAVKTGSRFKREIEKYKISDNIANEQMEIVKGYMKEEAYDPYYLYRQKNSLGALENIGYSKEDNICLYNISMIEERETIVGIGMGAVSKVYNKVDRTINRIPNFKSVNEYINRLDELLIRRNFIK